MKAKYYKDGCHHYKMINKYSVIVIYNGCVGATIDLQAALIKHFLNNSIKAKTIKPCTEKQYQKAFDKALKTINNQK